MSLMGSARQERQPRGEALPAVLRPNSGPSQKIMDKQRVLQDIDETVGEVNIILVFSDTHGRIPLMLRLVSQWQREHDRHVDLILVAGDLGVWPESERLDSSTRKYSQIDPAELGFQVFEPIGALVRGGPSTMAAAYLADAKKLVGRILPEINAKIVFVGGNHEDYDYLAACGPAANAGEQPLVAVEASRRLYWLRPGQVWELPNLRVTGLSGIDPAGCGRDAGRYHPASVMTEDSVIESTLAVLEASAGREIDVLLTHDGLPEAAKPGKGTFKLLEAITSLNPRYHFFGHYHSEVTPLRYADWLPQLAKWYPLAPTLCSDPGHLRTLGVHINKLAFDRRTGRLRQHVMGLLEIDDPEQYRFEFVQEDWLSNIDEQTMWRLRV
jgi:predicted phosphodiesterase